MNAAALKVRVFDTPEQLAHAAAKWIVARFGAHAGRWALCLSGGTTPKRLYQRLGEAPYRDRLPWQRAHCFWGDERIVPYDDPRSNFGMAWQALLRRVPIPQDNIHAMPTDGTDPQRAAAEYEAALQRFYGADALQAGRPLFDLTLLGLGEDGHLASLFPDSPALAETRRWVVPVIGEGKLDRITLTYPALASSAVAAFIVAGEHKRGALARLRAGDPALPAARLQTAGDIYCFADKAAAAVPALSGE